MPACATHAGLFWFQSLIGRLKTLLGLFLVVVVSSLFQSLIGRLKTPQNASREKTERSFNPS